MHEKICPDEGRDFSLPRDQLDAIFRRRYELEEEWAGAMTRAFMDAESHLSLPHGSLVTLQTAVTAHMKKWRTLVRSIEGGKLR